MSGFLGAIFASLVSAVSSVTDPFFNYVTLLLNGDGTNGAQNNTFLDSSPNNFAITRTGTPTQGTFSPFSQTGWSGYFNGSSDYIQQTQSLNAICTASSTVTFTIEGWIYCNSFANNGTGQFNALLSKGNIYLNFGVKAGLASFYWFNGIDRIIQSAITIPLATWTHIAVVVTGGTLTIYTNGVPSGSGAFTAGISTAAVNAGERVSYDGVTTYGNQYVSNLRVVIGSAVYTGNFTPPAAPLTKTQSAGTNISAITGTATSLLTLQDNRFVDNSAVPNTLTVTGTPSIQAFSPFAPSTNSIINPTWWGGSFSNSANTDRVYAPSNAAFAFGTGSFTLEAWIYPTATPTSGAIFLSNISSATGNTEIGINLTTARALQLQTWNTGIITPTGSVPLNAWSHTAATFDGATYRLFLNGVLLATSTAIQTLSSTNGFAVGGVALGGTSFFTGYIVDARALKGAVAYTTASTTAGTTIFTPPSLAPLQNSGSASAASYPSTTNVNTTFASSACSLLTLQNSTFVDNSIANGGVGFPITVVGRTNMQNISPFAATGWSGSFAGTTDWIYTPATTAATNGLAILAGNLTTIEFQVYPTSFPAIEALFGNYAGVAALGRYGIWIAAGSIRCAFTVSTSTDVKVTSTAVLTLNAWNHVAITIDATTAISSTVVIYTNGIGQTFTGVNLTTHTTNPGLAFAVGTDASTSPNYPAYAGYIGLNRVVRGALVYTGNFAPPIAPLASSGAASAASYSNTTNVNTSFASTACSLLTLQYNRFVDNGTNSLVLTTAGTPKVVESSPFPYTVSNTVIGPVGGSGYFNGSTDYLTLPAATPLGMGAGNFTIECFFYKTSTADGALNDYASGGGYGVVIQNNNIQTFTSVNGGSVVNFAGTIPLNQWNHLAVVKNSGTITCYINGTSIGTPTANSVTFTSPSALVIGRNGGAASQFFPGYIHGLRFVVGTAVYTGNFTPPTEPLLASGALSASSYPSTTNVNTVFPASQCSFLETFTNAGITDATAKNDLVTVGTAQISTAIKQFGTGSMKFDGVSTTNVLSTALNQSMAVGTVFTIEAWIYPTANGGTIVLGNATNCIQIGYNGTTAFGIAANAVGWRFTTTTLPTLNAWNYIAIVRTGTGTNQTFIYINSATPTATGTVTDAFTTDGVAKVGDVFNGYIDDLRITKGVARTITVPTQPFPVQ